MLPDNLFINLIDMDLQDRISNIDKMDKDAEAALSILNEQGPNTLRNGLEDWTIEKHNDKNVLFYKGKNYIPIDNGL